MTTARPTKPRNEGQWALGNREPLNPNEEMKQAGAPLDVRERIEKIYARDGFDSIDKSDLRGRFRWWGLYTQREQGYDGTFTGDDNAELLEARYFMMRVRCDGGALSATALRTVGQISTEFARDTADITDRENVQYHWIEVQNVPEIWRRLAEVGLQTAEACGDCPRVILGSPLAGESLDEVVGARVPLEEVPEVWNAVTSIFRDYGYRRLRSKARLKFLIKDWGIEKFREVLETEYLKRPLIDGPAPEPLKRPIDHVGVQRLKNGLNAVGAASIAGRVSGTILTAVAGLAERAGSDRIRLTPYQKLVILDVPDDKLDELIAGLEALGLHTQPSHWRRNVMACTGIEFCKLSFAETRVKAQSLVPDLERRLADVNEQLDVPITVNLNGCPNSCARIQVADIGLKGQMVDDGNGGSVEAFQVHLGGSLGLDSGFGRKLRQHKVTSDELGDYIERITRNFLKYRGEGERFAQWAMRADEDDLR